VRVFSSLLSGPSSWRSFSAKFMPSGAGASSSRASLPKGNQTPGVAVVVVPAAPNYLSVSHFADLLVRISRWPVLFVCLTLALACICRFGPSREAPRWRWITWGSAAATLFWLVASALFSWYAANFGKFNETCGSLGAAIGFMTWLWISAIVILLGAGLDAEIEHQAAHDTTTGSPEPMGARGARMADTIGAAAD
jgi:membrane protein